MAIILSTILILLIFMLPARAWSNGGYSSDPNYPKYGTHDMILNKSINMLPSDMKNKINKNVAFYGSEIPDCTSGIYCIGDVARHNVYYYVNKTLQRDIGAQRARDEYNLAKSHLQKGDKYNFSLRLGSMSHYISDMAVFGHTMGSGTYWGPEIHHSDYENYVGNHLSTFDSVNFDGKYDNRLAYNAALKMAYETTFDAGVYTNVWMDDNYNWYNPSYVSRTKYLINYNANILTDTLFTLIGSSFSPNSVANLKNTTYKKTYINWTWKDPADSDFSKVMIYIDGKFKTNVSKGKQYYNATGFLPDTSHRIGTHTVDLFGNINKTWINKTSRTAR